MTGFKSKSAIAGASLLICAAPAFGATVDNITIPTSSGSHVFTGEIYEPTLSNGVLSGYGRVTSFGGNLGFANGGELTFTYDNYQAATLNGNATGNFTGGNVTFYADNNANFDRSNPSTASDGSMFLQADGDSAPNLSDGDTLEGHALNPNELDSQNSAMGHLDVASGDAASIFDTNGYSDGAGGTSDLLFNATYSPDDGGDVYQFSGSADAHYLGSAVPEPSELGILALGGALLLAGLGFRGRNKRT